MRAITHEVMVMDAGRIVEHGPAGEVLRHPETAAARALVDAAPDLQSTIANRMAASG